MDKKEIPAIDYETGLVIARRYATQYLFDFYDITITRNPDNVSGSPGDMGNVKQKMHEPFCNFFPKASTY